MGFFKNPIHIADNEEISVIGMGQVDTTPVLDPDQLTANQLGLLRGLLKQLQDGTMKTEINGSLPNQKLEEQLTETDAIFNYEVASLSITAIPTLAGNVTITLNGVATTVSVDPATDLTTDVVATKIRNTAFTGWTTGGTASTVTFTATTPGNKTDAIYSAGTTGAIGTMTTTVQGTDHALTFSANVAGIGIYNTDAVNAGVFNVNGVDVHVPVGEYVEFVIGGTPSAEVTVTGVTTYIVSRLA